MINIEIRSALKREIQEIEAITMAAYMGYRANLPPIVVDAYFADLRKLANYWDEAEVLVADIGGRIGGSVLFYADASTEGLGLPNDWAGFRKLAVAPKLHGQGIGSKLVTHCLNMGRHVGANAVGIHTTNFMTAARRVYSDLDFRRCPEFDVKAADVLPVSYDEGDLDVIAYKHELSTYSGTEA